MSEIVCNLELSADEPIPTDCGDCQRCVRACPTGAIQTDKTIDARRCVSYLTIEHDGPIAPELAEKMGARIFGCDACQEACPHNVSCHPQAQLGGGLRSPPSRKQRDLRVAPTPYSCLAEILNWSYEDWDAATRGSAIRRAGYENFMRNAKIAADNSARRPEKAL